MGCGRPALGTLHALFEAVGFCFLSSSWLCKLTIYLPLVALDLDLVVYAFSLL